ncbi:MAG: sulfurtransferase-like selenium metabolism protein YedF [Cyanobacteria bacterium HKST-UBA02]|nr:sulfurtransferase-like selenium metabolism protein YedF [Cyanobacteria bacterium HKST-UBA02]
MKKEVDLRGLVCPEPVLRTKKLLDDKSVVSIEALVETEVNVKNLERLARSQKVSMTSAPEGEHFRVIIERNGESAAETAPAPAAHAHSQGAPQAQTGVGTVVFLGKDSFGQGDESFSRNLLDVFLQTMLDSGHLPRAILMANTGVKLLARDSSCRKVLLDFKEAGCDVLACGLCVEFYGLKEDIDKDDITNMFAICEYMMTADKVLSP